MVESTYGGKDNNAQPLRDQDQALQDIIINTVGRGGKVLMPTLGTGRDRK
jgi:predicted metal-dependent RNase